MATKRRRHRRRHTIRQETLRDLCLLGSVLVCAVLLFAGSQAILRSYVKKHDDGKILSGIYVGNTDVSGMNQKEALDEVQKEIANCRSVMVTVEIAEGKEIQASLEELGLSAPKAKDAVKEAVRFGKKGNTAQSYKLIKKAEKKKLEHHIPLEYEVEKQTASNILESRAKEFLDNPVNAAIVQGPEGIQVTEAQKGEGLNMEQTIGNLNQFLNEDWDGKPGTVQAVVEKKDAPVTADDLAGLTDILGSYTTYYGESGDGRVKNVETGAKHLDGILLKPGEEQSANAAMEPYTYENGYAEADSYESNTVVQTMGGGICQVSSTLYNALLYAELEIVERYPHSMLVSYVEASRDAAIADDLLDLVFKNNLDSPIYIQTVLAEGNLTFNIYGKETRNPGREIEFISESEENEGTEGTRFVATENSIGYLSLQSYAHPEITAQLWKVVTEDGQEVSRDAINYSQYMAAPETYGVGVVSDDPAETDLMNSAIMTQDQETIQNTIDQILYGPTESE